MSFVPKANISFYFISCNVCDEMFAMVVTVYKTTALLVNTEYTALHSALLTSGQHYQEEIYLYTIQLKLD